jgi:hypothetical protein
MYGGNYAIGVPVRVFDYDGYSLMDEDVFTDSHGIATLCPPSDIQYEGFMVGYRKYHYYSSGFSGTYYPVTDEYGNLLFGQFGVTEANLSYNLPGDSMVLQLNPANGATVAVFNSNPTKTFTWASVPNASYYTLLLQKTGQTVTTHQAYSTSYTASLSPGTWVWQVEAHFASSNYSVLSPVREFKVITTISSTTLSQNSGDQVSQTEKSQAESSSYEPPYEIFDADSYYNDCDAFDED